MRKILFSVVAVLMLASCGSDYLNDGGVHSNHTKHKVYDYLKGNATHMFDSTCLIIEKLGLIDEVNNCGTFFAYSDFSIRTFLKTRTTYLRNRVDSVQQHCDSIYTFTYVDSEGNTVVDSLKYENSASSYSWTLDSMLACFPADSFRMYMFNDRVVNNKALESDEIIYANQKDPKQYETVGGLPMGIVTVESTNTADWDLYQDGALVIETKPYYLYLVKVRGEGLDDPQLDWSGIPYAQQKIERDVTIGCRTTDIITSTGTILHVLHSQHYPYMFSSSYDPYYTKSQS